MVLIVLAMYGYDAKVESTITDSVPGMVLLMTGIPVVIGIIGIIFTLLYPLGDKKMKQIENDLIVRRQQLNAE
jgi:GPH family glycoside/pentoside/hexuronide:cation symporter